jgi:hypothetical protein
MSRKGAAIRIGTVPAVIMTGSIAARTNQTRADKRPSVTPIAAPTKAAIATFSLVYAKFAARLGFSTP